MNVYICLFQLIMTVKDSVSRMPSWCLFCQSSCSCLLGSPSPQSVYISMFPVIWRRGMAFVFLSYFNSSSLSLYICFIFHTSFSFLTRHFRSCAVWWCWGHCFKDECMNSFTCNCLLLPWCFVTLFAMHLQHMHTIIVRFLYTYRIIYR